MSENQNEPASVEKIIVKKDGPFVVLGKIPLVRKTQVVSEFGEPLTWKKEDTLEVEEPYCLCRCGHSGHKPFCDGSHHRESFDGAETASTQPIAERQITLSSGSKITVRRDPSVCCNSGFCGDRFANLEELALDCDDTRVRSLVIAMIERCPSGAYTYSIEDEVVEIEPDLPRQVAITTEITSDGPINGPLWVTGNIPVERADGQPFETRNRVTLCCCGESKNKPLCDGAHRVCDGKKG